MAIECEVRPCNNKQLPYCDCQWGSEGIPCQTATLCKEHAEELWERINFLVQLNKVWYRIDLPGKIKGEIDDRKRRDE